ncbi:hypothetical protein GCM10022238_30970 [Gordonia hankookensis]
MRCPLVGITAAVIEVQGTQLAAEADEDGQAHRAPQGRPADGPIHHFGGAGEVSGDRSSPVR